MICKSNALVFRSHIMIIRMQLMLLLSNVLPDNLTFRDILSQSKRNLNKVMKFYAFL